MNFGRIVDYKMKFKDKYNLNEREKKRIKEDIKNNCKKRIKEHIKGIIVSILSILLATIAEGFSLITTIVPLLFTIIPVAIHVVCTNINIKWKRENRIFKRHPNRRRVSDKTAHPVMLYEEDAYPAILFLVGLILAFVITTYCLITKKWLSISDAVYIVSLFEMVAFYDCVWGNGFVNGLKMIVNDLKNAYREIRILDKVKKCIKEVVFVLVVILAALYQFYSIIESFVQCVKVISNFI